jgi:hypothetical protein
MRKYRDSPLEGWRLRELAGKLANNPDRNKGLSNQDFNTPQAFPRYLPKVFNEGFDDGSVMTLWPQISV